MNASSSQNILVHAGSCQPQATLLFTACDQSEYIIPAVHSALAQTGITLEIILSDDASRDATARLMRKEAEAFRGPHRVIWRQNKTRIGLDHFHALNALATCDFRILAHGDDISYPERCLRLWQTHQETGASLVWSARYGMNGLGRYQNAEPDATSRFYTAHDLFESWPRGYCGAVMSWHREVIDSFALLERKTTPFCHDYILALRASFLRGMYFLNERLVRYRFHRFQLSRQFVVSDDAARNAEKQAWEMITAQNRALKNLDSLVEKAPKSQENFAAEKTKNLLTTRNSLQSDLQRNQEKWIAQRMALHAAGYQPQFIKSSRAENKWRRLAHINPLLRRSSILLTTAVQQLRGKR